MSKPFLPIGSIFRDDVHAARKEPLPAALKRSPVCQRAVHRVEGIEIPAMGGLAQ